MEQVFDLREFIVGVFKKFKILLILAIVFAIAGGAFGYASFPNNDKVQSNATATVLMLDKKQNATALESAMKLINSYITSDTFYVALLSELSANLDQAYMRTLFAGDETPKLDDVKEILKVYTKGNIVIVEVAASDAEITSKAAGLCIDYIVENVPQYNDTVEAALLSNETVNITKQNNDSAMKDAIKFAILGLAGGAALGILVIFFGDIFDLRVKKASDLRRFNIPILSDDMDRAVATAIASGDMSGRLTIVLTSSNPRLKSDTKLVGNCLQNAFARVNIASRVIDARGKAPCAITADVVSELFASVPESIIVCCDCINTSTDALYYAAGANGVILCEENKMSRTDEIASAVDALDTVKAKKLGIIII